MDRNQFDGPLQILGLGSPSSRRAWIEIGVVGGGNEVGQVALLAEGVDRNCQMNWNGRVMIWNVALLAEGVDRNFTAQGAAWSGRVALLAEGVDRNSVPGTGISYVSVALLAEGVDRNLRGELDVILDQQSPSSRRAWIEISSLSA